MSAPGFFPALRFCIVLVAALLPAMAAAEEANPESGKPDGITPEFRFKDFPAKVYKGKVARAQIRNNDYLRDYPESFSSASSEGVNFAGHYIIVKLPCGSACVNGAIVDARTGKTHAWPFNISGWKEVHDDFEAVEFRADSRLIIFQGSRYEHRPFGWHYYVMENGRLTYLRTVPNDGNFDKPLKHD